MRPGAKPKPPPSCTRFGLNLVALGVLLAATWAVRRHPMGLQDEVLVLFLAWTVPILVLDVAILRVHRNQSTGLDWDKPWSPVATRVLTKLLGLTFTVGCVAFAYWSLHEYHGEFYDPLWALLRRFRFPLLVSAPIYVTLVDGMMREPKDSYWMLGRVLLGKPQDATRAAMKQHFLGWLVKAFFFPLMLVWSQIYFMRARTEERHLSRDPTYVQYALRMNEHGVFAWLGRHVPGVRYRPPG